MISSPQPKEALRRGGGLSSVSDVNETPAPDVDVTASGHVDKVPGVHLVLTSEEVVVDELIRRSRRGGKEEGRPSSVDTAMEPGHLGVGVRALQVDTVLPRSRPVAAVEDVVLCATSR